MLLAPISSKSIEQEFAELDLRYGARIRVMTILERSDSFRNPGVSLFTEYLDRKGYDATGFVKSPLLIERLENTRVFLPLAWLYEWRRNLQAEIDSRFSRDTAGVLDAAMLGNRYNLSHSTAERFREGGTFHVLVISGLHITFSGSDFSDREAIYKTCSCGSCSRSLFCGPTLWRSGPKPRWFVPP